MKYIDPDGKDPGDGIFGFLSNLSNKIERFLGINQPSNLQGADRARQDLANLKAGQQRTEQLAAAVNTTVETLSYGFPLSNTAKVMAKSTRGVETTVGEKVFAGLEVVGLAASFVGAGLEGTTKIASTVAEKTVTKGGGNAFRYMTEGELKAIQQSGMLRGGNPGKTYFTKDLYKSGAHAQQRLSLPTTPTLRVEFEILNNPTMKLNGSKVLPDFGMPGKGAEFMTTNPVRVKLINWQPLK